MICPFCKMEFSPKGRSNQQNRYYWGAVLKAVSNHTGYSPDELHEFFKLKFNKEHISIGKDEVTIGKSTSSLQTMEFEQYLSKIIMFASMELGVIIPNPDETYAKSKQTP